MDTNYVRIFDTTLRDGEQSPGASLTSGEKLEIGRALAALGVDVIEAGFPAASPDDLEAVRRVAIEVGNPPKAPEDDGGSKSKVPIICGLARANKKDIDACWEAVKHAAHPRIHTFLATSPIHMKYKLRMDPEEVVEKVRDMVAYARSLCKDVEFSPEDAGRSEPDFLYLVLGEAIKAGATTLNIPDTVGYTIPSEFGELIKGIIAHTPGLAGSEVIVSTHCHNDLGMATANTLAGVLAGARQAEVTINGIGERAGNTSLEEVVMALHTRRAIFDLHTGVDTTRIIRTSHMVSSYTSIPVQPNKAVVGANAFAHEAGIHQDGVLKHQATYEIMQPEMVGLNRSSLVLGKHSGRHAFKVRLAELGFELKDDEVNDLFAKFKDLADKKKTIMDADLEALVEDRIYPTEEFYRLENLQVTCGTLGMATATVRMIGPKERLITEAAIGTGPVDAAFKAIDAVFKFPNTLLEYRVTAVTEGIDAVGEVSVRILAANGSVLPRTMPQSGQTRMRTFGGRGMDTDIIVASAKSYINALNKLMAARDTVGENNIEGL